MKLFILYEARCHHCAAIRAWLEKQETYFPLEFVVANSAAARVRFPGLENIEQTSPLVAVSDAGEVYEGADAYIMCFYALTKYRELSLRLAGPALQPFARQIFELISLNAPAAIEWINRKTSDEIAKALGSLPPMPCSFVPNAAPAGGTK